jgi:hypothetical protein
MPESKLELSDRLENVCSEAVELLTGGIPSEGLADLLAIRHAISRQQASEQVEIAKSITANFHNGTK